MLLLALLPVSLGQTSATEDPTLAIGGLVDAIGSSQTTLAVAFALSLLVWTMRNIPMAKGWMAKLPKDAMPWVAIGLGILGGVATALLEGKSVPEAAMYGVIVGLASAGTWSAGTKHLVKKKPSETGSSPA